MPLAAGDLRWEIEFHSRQIVKENACAVEDYVLYKAVFAKVEELRGRQPYLQNQDNAQADTCFTVRYDESLRRDMRIKYGGIEYDIISIRETCFREVMEVYAVARALP